MTVFPSNFSAGAPTSKRQPGDVRCSFSTKPCLAASVASFSMLLNRSPRCGRSGSNPTIATPLELGRKWTRSPWTSSNGCSSKWIRRAHSMIRRRRSRCSSRVFTASRLRENVRGLKFSVTFLVCPQRAAAHDDGLAVAGDVTGPKLNIAGLVIEAERESNC